ncbi:MAG: exodeoxyribonuclease VII small subunit [Oscillospiraceae bacterium]|nr:exodeoxyribonuclease VII small subunit [Oscillospiraceae bacterium]
MDLERSMSRLAEISEKMSGELPLEESMKLYTEAVGLVKQCREYIENAKLTVEQLEAAE